MLGINQVFSIIIFLLISSELRILITTNFLRCCNAVKTSTAGMDDQKLIRFWYFPNTNRDRTIFQEIKLYDVASLEAANLNDIFALTILIHGFNTNFTAFKSSTQLLKNAYLQNGFQNIMAVDWYNLAQTSGPEILSYETAVSNVPTVGKVVGKFLKWILKQGAIGSPQQIHLVGHSLGAHVSGIAGSTLANSTRGNMMVGRITGLDPAYPLYYKEGDNERRLDKSDAKFVDVLHTNVGMRGVPKPCGHVDFYANGGGPFQPGCLTPGPGDPDPIYNEAVTGICSHRRSCYFFAQTITPANRYVGCQCQQLPGEPTDDGNNNSNGTAAAALDPAKYQCNRIVSLTKLCNRPTPFGQYAYERARGLYEVEIQLKDPSKYYN